MILWCRLRASCPVRLWSPGPGDTELYQTYQTVLYCKIICFFMFYSFLIKKIRRNIEWPQSPCTLKVHYLCQYCIEEFEPVMVLIPSSYYSCQFHLNPIRTDLQSKANWATILYAHCTMHIYELRSVPVGLFIILISQWSSQKRPLNYNGILFPWYQNNPFLAKMFKIEASGYSFSVIKDKKIFIFFGKIIMKNLL